MDWSSIIDLISLFGIPIIIGIIAYIWLDRKIKKAIMIGLGVLLLMLLLNIDVTTIFGLFG